MTAPAAELDLGTLDTAVDAAIARGIPAGLPIVGFGEITLVVGSPPDRPRLAVKRLPVFESAAAAKRHAALIAIYTAALRERQVDVIDTAYEDPALLEDADAMGRRLGAGLDALIDRHPDQLAKRRGLGLMLALETHCASRVSSSPASASRMGCSRCSRSTASRHLQIMPPLVIAAEEVDDVLERLDAAVAAMGSGNGYGS